MSESGKKFSFGFSKSKQSSKLVGASILLEKTEKEEQAVEFLSSFEDFAPKSVSTLKKDEPIIPLTISRFNIREQLKKKYLKGESVDELTAEALRALSSDESVEIDASSQFANSSVVVELPSKGSSVSADDPVDADYDQIPIESFGLALLKGMGLKEEQVISQPTADYAAKVRLKGLGLGADPRALQKYKEAEKNRFAENNEKLTWKEGTSCQVVYGRNEGQYGVIKGLDGDTGRVIVQLASTKQVLKVMQATLRLVSSAEYNKFAMYLNSAEVKKYKDGEGTVIRRRADSKSGQTEADEAPFCVEKRRRVEDPAKRSSHSCGESTWLQKGLIVRYLDKESKYYLHKVKILSVSSSASHSHRCSCVTESGRTLKDIHEKYLQTTVPKRSGESVVVVRGPYLDEVGKLVERNDQSSQAYISLNSIGREIAFHYDDVCSFSN
uniref:KOW domain-containing protein n=1 Tax=Mesocestoides corti TaxID=53468 RepID=A0A5K3FZR7_MESCO